MAQLTSFIEAPVIIDLENSRSSSRTKQTTMISTSTLVAGATSRYVIGASETGPVLLGINELCFFREKPETPKPNPTPVPPPQIVPDSAIYGANDSLRNCHKMNYR